MSSPVPYKTTTVLLIVKYGKGILVPYKTSTVLLIVKSGKGPVVTEKRIDLHKTEKDQLPFEKWIFANGQHLHRIVCRDDFN